MLKTLTIKNVALIDSAEIEFENGLNVLSGETGAGKSVILESLNFVLGAKADKTLIRNGQSECLVKAKFFVGKNQPVLDLLNEFDIECDDFLILSRKLTVDGKGSVKINGESATVGMVKKLTANLVDVHGQSEHFSLLKTTNQLALIDKFCGKEVGLIKEKIAEKYSKYKSVCAELSKLGGDEAQRLIRIDILDYQIKEINECDLKDGEEDELADIKSKLLYQEKISSALSLVKSALKDEGGACDIAGNAMRALSSITDLSTGYSELYDRLSSAFSELDDIGETANSLIDDFDYSEYNLDSIQSRLDKIKSLKKKYGDSFDEIQTFLSNALSERDKLQNFNEIADELLNEQTVLQKQLYKDYIELSEYRRKYAKILCENVLVELRELGMPKATFDVVFNDIVSFDDCKFDSANGIDQTEFLFSANLGEPLKPLSAVISGGEMSRFMLAIKAQTAKYNEVSTFIFDEIDAGISGAIAKVVGEKFAKIAKDAQIIAISHLPQISVMANNNLLITKNEGDEKTVTSVKSLNKEEKLKEIVRLVGGSIESDSAKSHAIELINLAEEFKKNLQ